MKLCGGTAEERHAPIAHDRRRCPYCLSLRENESLWDQVEKLNAEVDELREKIANPTADGL